MGLKPDLQGGTGFNLLRVQFWTPLQRKRVLKRVRKWTPLKSKVVPPGGSSFGPFIVANLLKRLFQVEADFTSNSCDWNLELLEALIANSVLVCVTLLRFARLKKVLGWAQNWTSKEALDSTC